MFIPNTTGRLSSQTGFDVYAQPTFSAAKVIDCAIVHLNSTAQKTTVRADSSASRGTADEMVSDAKILFPARIKPAHGDRFQIQGFTLRVIRIEPRLSVYGRLDHFEVDFEHWGDA